MTLKVVKPSILTYLHYAHLFSIAETDSRSREYLAVSFLQLTTKPNSMKYGLLVDFFSHENHPPLCPFVSNELLKGDDIRVLGATAVEKACNLIDSGYYARVDLNEFYISESNFYQKMGQNLKFWPRKFRPMHFNLIHSYCVKRKIFFTHGFNSKQHYTKREISFDEFEKAYYGDDVGMRRLRLVPPEEKIKPLYSPTTVINYLTEFIESRRSVLIAQPTGFRKIFTDIMRYRSVFMGIQPFGMSFGMATYDVAAQRLSRRNGRKIDIRPWCLLHDHKRALLRLCDFLVSETQINLDHDLIHEFELIENDFLSLRNYLLESQLIGRKVKITSLRKNLLRLKDAERSAITALIEAIRINESGPQNSKNTPHN